MQACIPKIKQNRAPPACTNLQYFAIAVLKLSRKTIIYLLHVCWPMPICCKAQRKRGEKKRLMKVTKIGFLGVSFFLFLGFLVFVFWPLGFSVFWFVVGFLKGWQSNAKVKDRDLALCQFSHFRGCFGPAVPLENHVKNHGKMQVLLEAWGAWDTD